MVHSLIHALRVLTPRMRYCAGHPLWREPRSPSPPGQPQPGACEHSCRKDRCGARVLPWLPRASLDSGNQSPQGGWKCRGLVRHPRASREPHPRASSERHRLPSNPREGSAPDPGPPCARRTGLGLAFAALWPALCPSAGSPQGQRREGSRLWEPNRGFGFGKQLGHPFSAPAPLASTI